MVENFLSFLGYEVSITKKKPRLQDLVSYNLVTEWFRLDFFQKLRWFECGCYWLILKFVIKTSLILPRLLALELIILVASTAIISFANG